MKAIITALTILFISFVAPAFAADKTTDTADRQILGVLVALNNNEIAAAHYITKQKVDAQVKQFANLMIKDHTQNLHQTMSFEHKLGSPLESDDSKTMIKDGNDELATLKTLKGKELETAYIDAMVKGHQAALQTIDDNLLKNVTGEALKKQLEATRTHVEHHLEVAKEIQGKLQATT
ncbi:MAG: DUF4142 domain-containing protein [Pseudomonadota bacterium]